MKTIYTLLFMFFILTISCKKEYTCRCTTVVTGSSANGSFQEEKKIKSKDDGNTACNTFDITVSVTGGGTSTTDCSLK